jgi:hypothetical protein
MIHGYAAIHPHSLGLFMLRGISGTGQNKHAKQWAINAFDPNYLLSAEEVIASILHVAHNMEEELPLSVDSALSLFYFTSWLSLFGILVVSPQVLRLWWSWFSPEQVNACGGPDHIMSFCKTTDDTLLK